jgi:hypothetical protein
MRPFLFVLGNDIQGMAEDNTYSGDVASLVSMQ